MLKHCDEYGAVAAVRQYSLNVIASAAKQSIVRHQPKLDCFVASAPRNDG
jgi:hypothetical protein